MQMLEKKISKMEGDNKIQALENLIKGIKEERLKFLEKGMQAKGNIQRIQTLEEAVKNVCVVVDAMMKKAAMAIVLGLGKIKQQRKKGATDKEDLVGKMERKTTVHGIVEDLLKAWKLIEDA